MTTTRATKTSTIEKRVLATPTAGTVGRLLSWVGRVLRVLLASLAVSIATEWVGIHLWWSELGTEHSRQMVQVESGFLDQNISNSWVRGKPAAAVNRLMSDANRALKRSKVVEYVAEWPGIVARRLSSSATWQQILAFIRPYAIAARNITRLYVIRLTVLCLAAPLFVLLICVGLVDGLVQRDLRRWGGGRESSYVYHYAKRSNVVFVALGAFVYLAMPFSIHPAAVLVPFAVMCGLTVSVTASRFKKYL